MTGPQQELGQVLSAQAVVRKKPVLAQLTDDIRRAADALPAGARRLTLEGFLVGLQIALSDHRYADIQKSDADEFCRAHGIERSPDTNAPELLEQQPGR